MKKKGFLLLMFSLCLLAFPASLQADIILTSVTRNVHASVGMLDYFTGSYWLFDDGGTYTSFTDGWFNMEAYALLIETGGGVEGYATQTSMVRSTDTLLEAYGSMFVFAYCGTPMPAVSDTASSLAFTFTTDGPVLLSTQFNPYPWTPQYTLKFYDPNTLINYSLSGILEAGGYSFELSGYNLVDVNFDFKATPVPEPATMLLLGSGLIGLAGLRRKFRKR